MLTGTLTFQRRESVCSCINGLKNHKGYPEMKGGMPLFGIYSQPLEKTPEAVRRMVLFMRRH